MLLNEKFDIKYGTVKKADGTPTYIVYIDPNTSENTYQYKDQISKKFGAKWHKGLKTWVWYVPNPSTRQTILDAYVKPCIEFLVQNEQPDANGNKREVIDVINQLIAAIDGGEVGSANDASISIISPEELKAKLTEYKISITNAMNSDEFKRMLEPLIKFRQAQGHRFSFLNALLIMIQDPEATMVKSRGNWKKFHRSVKPNSKAIYMWVPMGGKGLSDEEKETVKANYCAEVGAGSVKELNPGQKEELRTRLSKTSDVTSFKLLPYFFDVRFTEQIEGEEDLIGDGKPTGDIQWHEDTDETSNTIRLIDSVMKLIEKSGVKLDKVDSLGGALGVSKSGSISVLKDAKRGGEMFNTLVHEFAHELLHQEYLRSKNPELQIFVGRGSRGVVEQQAEICAYMVLKTFGLDLRTSLNYVGIWGGDDKTICQTIDTVWKAVTYIVNGINENMSDQIQESRMINEDMEIPSPQEMADMFGVGDEYARGKQEEERDSDMFESIIKKTNKKLF